VTRVFDHQDGIQNPEARIQKRGKEKSLAEVGLSPFLASDFWILASHIQSQTSGLN
jgi:hypothetical protein